MRKTGIVVLKLFMIAMTFWLMWALLIIGNQLVLEALDSQSMRETMFFSIAAFVIVFCAIKSTVGNLKEIFSNNKN